MATGLAPFDAIGLGAPVSEEDSDELVIKPLLAAFYHNYHISYKMANKPVNGAGQEVGRSCILLQFKGKKILLDCGIHPGMSGVDALPFVDLIDCEKLDLLLVTHFHLDHCGALPWFLEKTAFRGRCFMTHATKAIYRMLIGDYIKVSQYGGVSHDRQLYTEEDLEKSMEKIEVVDFHEQKEVNGIRFWPYVAGHVLGAAMFMIEIAGVKILYTGDFSRLEDRHLCAAEIPNIRPDVLITVGRREATYGTQLHEEREVRERRFTSLVHEIVARGGRCLIPAFALGRAQELLLILDEYWQQHPQLNDIPIYYASSLAKKCMSVYQTLVSGMNSNIHKQIALNNPFVFKHISNLKSIDHFEDVGPCVVLASPGMMQSGLSRQLFETWCTDPKNGCIVAGYCVEGTLAKHILSEPEEILAINGHKLPVRLQVAYISFSAHTDYRQTSEFIRITKPSHVVLVHGEMNEMSRLKAAIIREYEDDDDVHIEVYNPRNTEAVQLQFRGQKTAKVVGKSAMEAPADGKILSGVLVRRNFNYHLMHPSDLSAYTELAKSALSQRQSVFYSGSVALLEFFLSQVAGDVKHVSSEQMPTDTKLKSGDKSVLQVFNGAVTLHYEQPVVILEWLANPVNDMYADACLAAILQAESNPIPEKNVPEPSKTASLAHLQSAIRQLITEICGDQAIVQFEQPPGMEDNRSEMMHLQVNDREVQIDLTNMDVRCEDEAVHHLLSTVVNRLHKCLMPAAYKSNTTAANR